MPNTFPYPPFALPNAPSTSPLPTPLVMSVQWGTWSSPVKRQPQQISRLLAWRSWASRGPMGRLSPSSARTVRGSSSSARAAGTPSTPMSFVMPPPCSDAVFRTWHHWLSHSTTSIPTADAAAAAVEGAMGPESCTVVEASQSSSCPHDPISWVIRSTGGSPLTAGVWSWPPSTLGAAKSMAPTRCAPATRWCCRETGVPWRRRPGTPTSLQSTSRSGCVGRPFPWGRGRGAPSPS